MSALVTMLNQAVDYAGLFPPAALELATVAGNYADYRHSSQRWMLARLVIPAGRLQELIDLAGDFVDSQSPWPLSLLVPAATDEGMAAAIEAMQHFIEGRHPALQIASLETRANSVEELPELRAALEPVLEPWAATAGPVEIFVEIPHAKDPAERIAAIRETNGQSKLLEWKAKIRTGGVRADLIPPAADVARFILGCANHGVAMKATAGLHHPIRAEYNLTYEDDSPRAAMHGFINLFVACGLAFTQDVSAADLEQVLLETEPAKFQFDGHGISWNQWHIDLEGLQRLRREFLSSFGSCSFTEPVADLQQLGFGAALAEMAS